MNYKYQTISITLFKMVLDGLECPTTPKVQKLKGILFTTKWNILVPKVLKYCS